MQRTVASARHSRTVGSGGVMAESGVKLRAVYIKNSLGAGHVFNEYVTLNDVIHLQLCL